MKLKELVVEYLQSLRDGETKDKTIKVYERYLKLATAHFKGERDITAIKLPQVGKFFKSDAVIKGKNGKDRSEITSRQIRRVFRQLMVYALEQEYITILPMPKTEMEQARKVGIEHNKEIVDAKVDLAKDIDDIANPPLEPQGDEEPIPF